jgi:hypothetical protein
MIWWEGPFKRDMWAQLLTLVNLSLLILHSINMRILHSIHGTSSNGRWPYNFMLADESVTAMNLIWRWQFLIFYTNFPIEISCLIDSVYAIYIQSYI